MKCPKCNHERDPFTTVPSWQCPACKICYSKYEAHQKALARADGDSSGTWQPYVANYVSRTDRVIYALLSISVLAYALWGLMRGDVYIPSPKGGWHFVGLPAFLAFLALGCMSVSIGSVVLDHYDMRDNESTYERTQVWLQRAGWLLLAVAFFAGPYAALKEHKSNREKFDACIKPEMAAFRNATLEATIRQTKDREYQFDPDDYLRSVGIQFLKHPEWLTYDILATPRCGKNPHLVR
jgi:hypothetical protein